MLPGLKARRSFIERGNVCVCAYITSVVRAGSLALYIADANSAMAKSRFVRLKCTLYTGVSLVS